MDTNEQRQESQQNRREERHKRRQRSQIIAYTVVGIMILVLAAGIAFDHRHEPQSAGTAEQAG
mgnify:CR=1 FL=1